eukprot:TRINITY_DN3060_c0_g1_i1.p1 TRINITY_DN3060_c0_g1~~TRINITY_DN3060_c0_g1_i1.p1  ORF type:complete len:323 (+),score=44.48 TRINITY_DN3060_c0_g1_i1:57-1025(+)
MMNEQNAFSAVVIFCCFLSILGCFFTVVSFLMMKGTTKVYYRFVFALSIYKAGIAITGLFTQLFNIFGGTEWMQQNQASCEAVSTVISFCQKASWVYITAISINLVLLTRSFDERTPGTIDRHQLKIHIFAFIFAAATSFTMLIPSHFHINGNIDILLDSSSSNDVYECYEPGARVAWVLALEIPVLILFIINLGCSCFVLVHTCKSVKKNEEVRTQLLTTRNTKKIRNFMIRIAVYPILFFVIYFPVVMMRGRMSSDWVPLLSGTSFASGFWVAIFYAATPQALKLYRRIISQKNIETRAKETRDADHQYCYLLNCNFLFI